MATTNVNTSLPDIELAPGSTITVDTGDASATISLLNVYTVSPVSGARSVTGDGLAFDVLLAYDLGARAPTTTVPVSSPAPAPEPVPLPPGPVPEPIPGEQLPGEPVWGLPHGHVIETDLPPPVE